jgi:superfamily II DNA or RNA helicase
VNYLRPYQSQALSAFRAVLSPDVNRVAVELATGLGKTVAGAQAAVDFLESFEGAGCRVLIIVHTDEICAQWLAKCEFAVSQGDPDHPWTVGVVKAGRNEPAADIVIASVQTLAIPSRREQIRDVGFVIVDEAHHAVAPSYVAALRHFGALSEPPGPAEVMGKPGGFPVSGSIPALGLSATLARSDGQGLGRVWQDMPFSRNLSWAIRKGWLIDLVPYTVKIPDLDTSGSDSALDQALADSIAPEAVVGAWLEKVVLPDLGQGSTSTVLFAPLVKSAQAFADAFNAAGVKAEVVHGKMADAEVAAVLERYESGTTTVVCNAMKLTEGWDSPRSMCVIVARPTQSVPLFVQMIGRGLRPWLGQDAPPRAEQRCILLCVQGTVQDIVTVADLSEKIGDVREGQSFLAMEDQWDLGKDIPAEDTSYHGPVRVEAWDPLVQASSKAWNYTVTGVPYLPVAKRAQAYVFLVQEASGWGVWHYGPAPEARKVRIRRLAMAPDLELAMSVAEDEAQERGGDIGALLADKGRAWRKGVPTDDLLAMARRLLEPHEVDRVLASKASGKAGKLSDLVSRVEASRRLDPQVAKIKERGSKANA